MHSPVRTITSPIPNAPSIIAKRRIKVPIPSTFGKASAVRPTARPAIAVCSSSHLIHRASVGLMARSNRMKRMTAMAASRLRAAMPADTNPLRRPGRGWLKWTPSITSGGPSERCAGGRCWWTSPTTNPAKVGTNTVVVDTNQGRLSHCTRA